MPVLQLVLPQQPQSLPQHWVAPNRVVVGAAAAVAAAAAAAGAAVVAAAVVVAAAAAGAGAAVAVAAAPDGLRPKTVGRMQPAVRLVLFALASAPASFAGTAAAAVGTAGLVHAHS